jgi:uncharacterized BrkB/YihY/UPF0761 family membrane protein
MKTIGTFLFAPLIVGLGMAIFVLTGIDHESYNFLQWRLAIVAVLLVGLIVGALVNFAMFAPVYWFLGRLHLKKTQLKGLNISAATQKPKSPA